MCDPVTASVVIAGIGLAQAGAKYVGQNEAFAANQTAANLNYAQKADTISAQSRQLDQQKSETAFDTALTGIRAEGDAAAGASASGAAPSSIAHSINASMFGIGRNATAEETNQTNQRLQLGTDLTGAGIQRQTDISKVAKGSLITLGIGAASAISSGYGNYAKATG